MFQENVKILRKAKGLTQEELAIRLHVVRQTVSKWEKGLSVPDAEMLQKIADILETTVSKLLGAKIEEESSDNVLAEQLARINEQLVVKNRRARRIWKTIAICIGAGLLLIILLIAANVIAFQTFKIDPAVNFEHHAEVTDYHSVKCIYMNPLSSQAPVDTNGLTYELDENYFGIHESETGRLIAMYSSTNAESWQELPYTEEEWNDMCPTAGEAARLSSYEERMYKPLPGDEYMLLKMDGHMWVAKMTDDGDIWSIYEILEDK